jgi:hypothetical protein
LPFLVAHLSLFSEDGSSPLDMVAAPGSDGHAQEDYRRLLYGGLVSSAHILDDLSGQSGLFFIFADVSIRFRGRYKLGVTLFKLFRRVYLRDRCRTKYNFKISLIVLASRSQASREMF